MTTPTAHEKLAAAYKVIVDHLRANTTDVELLANFLGTEDRCARAIIKTCTPETELSEQIRHIIGATFPVHRPESIKSNGMVTQGPITINSMCPHHLYPVRYSAYVSYIPEASNVLGLSKLARICKTLGRRPVLHEQLASDIAGVLHEPDHGFVFPSIRSKGSAVMLVGLHTCFSPDTEILTEKGWVTFENLNRKTRVVQVDSNNMNADLVLPTNRIKQLNSSDHLLHIVSPGVNILCTPDHELLYKTSWKYRSSESVWEKTRADNLPGEFYLPQAVDWSGQSVGEVFFDGKTLTPKQYVALLGLYQSEGCWRGETSYQDVVYDRRGIEINQKRGTKEHRQILKLLASLPFELEIREHGDIDYIFIHSEDLPKYLLQFGRYCTENRIPRIVLNATKKEIRHYLKWYYIGDGDKWHNDPPIETNRVFGSKVISTSSKLMARDLQEAYLKVGIVTHVHSYEGADYQSGGNKYRIWEQNTKFIHHKKESIKRDAAFVRKSNISEVAYSGLVYCVTVPKGNIVVRREGKIVVVGNCMSCRGVEEDALTSVVEMRGDFLLDNMESKFYHTVHSIKTSTTYAKI